MDCSGRSYGRQEILYIELVGSIWGSIQLGNQVGDGKITLKLLLVK
jgi:hypothetical protein